MTTGLTSAVSGLNAQQQMLNVIGDNLANLNTTGFKEQSPSFQDLLYQTLSPGSPPTNTAGGTNPIQSGSGVTLSAISSKQQQGSLQKTGNPLDLAIQGNGFFSVTHTQLRQARKGLVGCLPLHALQLHLEIKGEDLPCPLA